MIRKVTRIICAAAASLLLLVVVLPAQQRNVDDFFRDFTADWVRHDADLATRARYFTGEEQDRLERELRPWTLEWRKDRIERAKQGLAELRKFDRAKMSEVQQVSADLMQWQLQTVADEEPYLDYTFPLEQFQGANETLVYTLTVVHPLKTEKDAANYVAALGEVSMRLEEAMAESRRLAAKGILPPKFILQATIQQMQSFVGTPAAENPFVTTPRAEDAADRSDVRVRGARSCGPRRKRLSRRKFTRRGRRASRCLRRSSPSSTDDAGLWRLKGGADDYRYALRRYTTTNMSPEQIHELGLRQVATIEKQMDGVLRQLGRTEGTVKERIEKLQADMMYPNPTSDESREQIMRDIDANPARRAEAGDHTFRQAAEGRDYRAAVSAFPGGQRGGHLDCAGAGRIAARNFFVSEKAGLHDEVRAAQHCLSRSGAGPFFSRRARNREYGAATIPADPGIRSYSGLFGRLGSIRGTSSN